MSETTLMTRLKNGIWKDNPGLVQLLGLCPLLAVTSTLVNGIGLGIATLLVLTFSNALVSATRRWILSEIRIPIYVLIIASLVTCIELIFKAWFPTLDRSLGIFHPTYRYQLRNRRSRRNFRVEEFGHVQHPRWHRDGYWFRPAANAHRSIRENSSVMHRSCRTSACSPAATSSMVFHSPIAVCYC